MKLQSLSDEELVELVREKDQEQYREVVRRYQNRLLRYATYLVNDQNNAVDVVQNAFIKAFVNLRGFDTNKKFSSWIYRITHNEAINYIKKHKKEISLESNEWIKETIRSSQDIEIDFNRKETEKSLKHCLDQLPIKYRSVLTLYYIEEKSYEEISDVLRIPMGTVATHINRGKKAVRVLYEKLAHKGHKKNI